MSSKLENITIAKLESGHMTEKRRKIYIAIEDLDCVWDIDHVKDFEYLWNEGHTLSDIAKYLKRDIDEVAILLLDRARKGKVKSRESGIW